MKHEGSPRFRYFRDKRGIPHLWMRADIDGDWRADLRLAIQGDRFVVSEARLFPSDEGTETGDPWKRGEEKGVHAAAPAGGVARGCLRRVPLHFHERLFYPLHAVDLLLDREGKPLPRQAPSSPRKGRPAIPDKELLRVAQTYDRAIVAGKPPTRAVMARLEMSEARARDLVYRARQRGFLTEAIWGRASGRLTAEASELLKSKRRRKGAKK